jgi:hypothetical protein
MASNRKRNKTNVKENKRVTEVRVDKPEDVKMQQEIKSRANYSLALLGMAFVRNGSGRFLNLRAGSLVKQ